MGLEREAVRFGVPELAHTAAAPRDSVHSRLSTRRLDRCRVRHSSVACEATQLRGLLMVIYNPRLRCIGFPRKSSST